MSQHSLIGHIRVRVAEPLVGRDPREPHRAATPLELFFDLVFVVAVALASERLHHGLTEGAVGSSVISFALVFFAIYWAWVNFTWFASAYDNDDLVFRLFVFVTMTGALIFAAGVPLVFDHRDFTVVVAGFVVMRLALITQWLRVAAADGPRRHTGRRFAAGLGTLQLAWLGLLWLPDGLQLAGWVVLALGELAVPIWAESATPTTWHADHIVERYGLFMIIVLGESVLAASIALQTVTTDGGATASVVPVLVGGLLVLFVSWWVYFDRPGDPMLASLPATFLWSYLHLLVFASAAAVGAGLAVAIEGGLHPGELGPVARAMTVAIPFASYLLCLWAMHGGSHPTALGKFGIPVVAALVLAATLTPWPVLLMGAAATAWVAAKTGERLRRQESARGVSP